jgi:sugar phosphate isomerase/epimerase
MTASFTRRKFIGTAALGVTAALGARTSAFGTQAQPPGMFVSLAPWATARGVGWPDQARLAAKTGYSGIDWSWAPVREAGADATRALLADLRLHPTIVNMPGPNVLTVDEPTFKASLAQLDEDTAFAASIGCSRFQRTLGATTPQGRTKEDHWKIVTGRLAAVSQIVSRHKVHVSLEFLGPLVFRLGRGGGGGRRGGAPPDPNAPPPPPPTTFVYSLAETLRLCEASGPNIGVTLDAWHWYHSGGTVADILATPRERIVHIHVSDARQMPAAEVLDNMRLLPGEGVIDLVGFFQALRKIGWSGGVACETIGPRLDNVSAEEQARLGLETTTALMKRAGVL